MCEWGSWRIISGNKKPSSHLCMQVMTDAGTGRFEITMPIFIFVWSNVLSENGLLE